MMYRNLKAEQARHNLTNQRMAEILHLSRGGFENKLRNGKFFVNECVVLCRLFDCKFDYLFATDNPA